MSDHLSKTPNFANADSKPYRCNFSPILVSDREHFLGCKNCPKNIMASVILPHDYKLFSSSLIFLFMVVRRSVMLDVFPAVELY